jgi:riboflavin synthase
MFTGLIETVGVIEQVTPRDHVVDCVISTPSIMDDCAIDDSIAINGVCLTVTARTETSIAVTMVDETLRKTSLADAKPGMRVNVERAVRVQDRLGGHIVQGHVDCTGIVDAIEDLSPGWNMWARFPAQYRPYLIPVGSVCVDGVSLTVARIEDERFMVALIPHTLSVTTLGERRVGDTVNLEFDVLAKYVESLLKR